MGLDIIAYENTYEIHDATMDNEGEITNYAEDSYIIAELGDYFHDHAATIKNSGIYTTNDRSFAFYAGSYSTYGNFREELAEFAGYPYTVEKTTDDTDDKPYSLGAWEADQGLFHELINFSDYEGIIAGPYSQKLLNDFVIAGDSYTTFFAQKGDWGKHCCTLYKNFQKAFQLAANNGLVSFE